MQEIKEKNKQTHQLFYGGSLLKAKVSLKGFSGITLIIGKFALPSGIRTNLSTIQLSSHCMGQDAGLRDVKRLVQGQVERKVELGFERTSSD